MSASLDQLAVNTLRFLSVDQVERANSGHPGLPLGAAPMAYSLWRSHLRFDPHTPDWWDRDRFILSAGHGSALLYSLLHVFGYDCSMQDLQGFRQLGSRTAGHPEFGMLPGVEATTGPLGQGCGMSVGMAIAARLHAAQFGDELVQRRIYALISDGDVMEGIGHEAAALAGHLGLGRLIWLYDDNDVSLDGHASLSMSGDIPASFEAMGWHVQRVSDGTDLEDIDSAIEAAKSEDSKPSLISIKTVIGHGSPKAGTSKAHGAPLGEEAVAATRKELGWPSEAFHVPDAVSAIREDAVMRGKDLFTNWSNILESSAHKAEIERLMRGDLPDNWAAELDALSFESGMATRDAGNKCLNALAGNIPEVVGGGADLATSTKTVISDGGDQAQDSHAGRNIWFGVREHAMGAAVNGLALSGFRPFGSTFLVFSDYMRGAIRLSALMGVNSTWVFTHDSIFVGEDGPTHQPIEHVMALRLIPDLVVLRPADAEETREAWRIATERQGPTALVCTRQKLDVLPQKDEIRSGVAKGGYVLREGSGPVLIATGSEVHLALAAADELDARVVSLPSWELFRAQDAAYRNSVIPLDRKRIAIEAGRTLGWHEWIGDEGLVIGLDRFGESGPGGQVYEHFNFTPDHVVEAVRSAL